MLSGRQVAPGVQNGFESAAPHVNLATATGPGCMEDPSDTGPRSQSRRWLDTPAQSGAGHPQAGHRRCDKLYGAIRNDGSGGYSLLADERSGMFFWGGVARLTIDGTFAPVLDTTCLNVAIPRTS